MIEMIHNCTHGIEHSDPSGLGTCRYCDTVLDCNLPPATFQQQMDAKYGAVGEVLCREIRRHGFPCRVEYPDGKLVIRAASLGVGRDGKGHWYISIVEPTLSAVRTWLGY